MTQTMIRNSSHQRYFSEITYLLNNIEDGVKTVKTRWGLIYLDYQLDSNYNERITRIRCDFGGEILDYFRFLGQLNNISIDIS